MWSKFFFFDFDEQNFGYDSDNFKKKLFLKLMKKNFDEKNVEIFC